jgi:hypothetical protein
VGLTPLEAPEEACLNNMEFLKSSCSVFFIISYIKGVLKYDIIFHKNFRIKKENIKKQNSPW